MNIKGVISKMEVRVVDIRVMKKVNNRWDKNPDTRKSVVIRKGTEKPRKYSNIMIDFYDFEVELEEKIREQLIKDNRLFELEEKIGTHNKDAKAVWAKREDKLTHSFLEYDNIDKEKAYDFALELATIINKILND